MRLVEFQVSNFRSVLRSGVIEIDNVTCLVGVNESGKTNLLLPLWKFNPAKEGKLEPTADYPKSTFTEIRNEPKKFVFVKVNFELDENERRACEELTGYNAKAFQRVILTRNYAGEFSWEFPNGQPAQQLPTTNLHKALSVLSKSIENLTPLNSEASAHSQLIAEINSMKSELADKTAILKSEFSKIYGTLQGFIKPEASKKSTLQPIVTQAIESLASDHELFHRPAPTSVEGLWELFHPMLPVFLYYSHYGNLDSEIYLPHVVENLARADLGAKEAAKARTLRVLFKFVGLNPQEILELGRDFKDPANPTRQPTTQEIDAINLKKKERSNLLQSASTKLTTKFREWWRQGDYRFRFEADGDHFRIWVSDDRRHEEVELEGRSTGLQWFLSFYLVFLVETEGEHKNTILLLDEPGLSLHPLAQRDLLAFFENLSKSNQIIFTTHSPFLIDSDSLHKARKVYVGEDGTTKATSNLNEGESKKSQKGAYYALSSALNLHTSETFLIGCEPIIVEGISDQHYLSTIKNLLISDGTLKPRKELVFPPGGGAKNVKVISSILLGRDDAHPVILLDDDNIGQSASRELKKELYKGKEEKVLGIEQFSGIKDSEIEDLIPPNTLIDVIDREFKSEEAFLDAFVAGKAIVPQIEAWAEKNGIRLEPGWKVPISVAVKKRLANLEPAKIDATYKAMWNKLFDAILEAAAT